MSIKIADFSKTIENILDEYGDEVRTILSEETISIGKKAVKELKTNSPPKNKGRYAKGWRAQNTTSRLGSGVVVYNATSYQLTHLLEHGHAKRGGGSVAAIEHIRPVNDAMQEEYINKIEERLS